MPSHVIADSGAYNVWAHPSDKTPSAVTITATGHDSTVLAQAYWTPNPPDVPGFAHGGRETIAQFHDLPAGATITTSPDNAHLIILRASDLADIYDSDVPGRPT